MGNCTVVSFYSSSYKSILEGAYNVGNTILSPGPIHGPEADPWAWRDGFAVKSISILPEDQSSVFRM